MVAAAVVCIGGIIGIVVGISSGISHEVDKAESVAYKVTGTAKTATVAYTTWNHENTSTAEQVVTLPWTQNETSSGLVKGGVLRVSVGSGGGTVTCSVSVDGGAPSTSTATGPFSNATCDGTD